MAICCIDRCFSNFFRFFSLKILSIYPALMGLTGISRNGDDRGGDEIEESLTVKLLFY